MPDHMHTLEAIRSKGYRLTPQRVLIMSVVANGDGHMGADEVFRRAREAYPYMDLTTVYRTLQLFRDLGVVTEVAIGDRRHFELTDPNGRHHHMVCRICAGAFNLSPHYLEEFQKTLMDEFGFEPDLDNFTVTGMCSVCQEASSV